MQSTFSGNQVTVNGAFGGAIFHDFCDKDKRAKTDRSFFTANKFINNKSAGFGGAGMFAAGHSHVPAMRPLTPNTCEHDN